MMCVAPISLPEVGSVACRYCWQCQRNRINDLIGRCIAEQSQSSATYAFTFTYDDARLAEGKHGTAPVHVAALVYPDFQKLVKRLRKAGYRVRYLVAGEYGSDKGRAHWHAVLFFHGKVPPVAESLTERKPEEIFIDRGHKQDRFDWTHWGLGHVLCQRADYGGLQYVVGYVMKDASLDVDVRVQSMSKKPPLGYGWFMQLAERYVERGLSPQNPGYAFRDQFDAKGKRRAFWLQGRMREIFIARYLDLWEERHGTPYPYAEWIEETEDKWIREAKVLTNEEWEAQLRRKHLRPDPEKEDTWAIPSSFGEVSVQHFPNRRQFNITVEGQTWHDVDGQHARRILESLKVEAPYISLVGVPSLPCRPAGGGAKRKPPRIM